MKSVASCARFDLCYRKHWRERAVVRKALSLSRSGSFFKGWSCHSTPFFKDWMKLGDTLLVTQFAAGQRLALHFKLFVEERHKINWIRKMDFYGPRMKKDECKRVCSARFSIDHWADDFPKLLKTHVNIEIARSSTLKTQPCAFHPFAGTRRS